MKFLKSIFIATIFLLNLNAMAQNPHEKSGLKKVIVQEILQVDSYTYINVLEDGAKKWLAVPKMEAKLGEVYYYKGGMKMPNFESKELNRKFDEVLFLGSITNADFVDPAKGTKDSSKKSENPGKKPTLDKLELSMDAIDGGIRIAELFENKEKYNGKKVLIKGEVTKFSSSIMKRNWVHFQDGTMFENSYDLMITTQENVNVGDVVVFEGIINLNKDFGAGYFYDIIMEEAVIQK